MQNEPQAEKNTTNSLTPLIDLIEDALTAGVKLDTGYIDEDLPTGDSVLGCHRKGCMNGYIERPNGAMAYCECYKEHLFQLKLLEARIPSEYHQYSHIQIDGLQVGKKPFSKPQSDFVRVDINQDIEKIVQNLDTILKDGWNFIIEGPTGSGKTTFASIIARMAITSNRSALFLELEELRRMYTGEELPKSLQDAKKKLNSVDLLILDDLGKEYLNESSEHFPVKLDSLFRQRLADKKTTVFTTNLTSDKISVRYDERFLSLLQKRMVHYLIHRQFDLRYEESLPDFLI